MMKKLLSTSALALMLSVSAAGATVSVSMSSSVDWNGFDGEAVGQSGTFSIAGLGTFTSLLGSGTIYNSSIPGTAANPSASTDNFLAVAGVEQLTLAHATDSFTFQWGSVDSVGYPGILTDQTWNGLQIFSGANLIESVYGYQILDAMSNLTGYRTAYVTITAPTPITEIRFGSVFSDNTPAAAFEFRANPAAAPEPSTWLMMLLGFAGLGIATYRHNGRRAVEA